MNLGPVSLIAITLLSSCTSSRPNGDSTTRGSSKQVRQLVEDSQSMRQTLYEFREKLVKSTGQAEGLTVVDLFVGSDHPALQAAKIQIVLDLNSRAMGIAGDIDGILNIAASNSMKPELMSETLAGIGEGLLLAGKREKADAIITQAERLSEQTDAESTSIAGRVAVLSAQLGRWEIANRLATKVRAPAARCMALNGIAEALVDAGLKQEAISTAIKSRDVARELDAASDARINVLEKTSMALAKAGNVEEALATKRRERYPGYRSIARTLAQVGQVDEARRIAQMERDPTQRYYALTDTTMELWKKSKADDAARVVADARIALGAIPARERAYAAVTLVALLTVMGRDAEALTEAEKISSPEQSARGKGLALAAAALARAGKTEESKKWMAKAITALPSRLSSSSVSYREVASELVAVDAYDQAIPYLNEGLTRDRQETSTYGRYLGLVFTADVFLDAKSMDTVAKLIAEVETARRAHKWEKPEEEAKSRAVVAILAARLGQHDKAKELVDQSPAGEWPTAYKLWAYSVLLIEPELQRDQKLEKKLETDYFRLPGTP